MPRCFVSCRVTHESLFDRRWIGAFSCSRLGDCEVSSELEREGEAPTV